MFVSKSSDSMRHKVMNTTESSARRACEDRLLDSLIIWHSKTYMKNPNSIMESCLGKVKYYFVGEKRGEAIILLKTIEDI